MIRFLHKSLLLLITICSLTDVFSQNYLGVHNSNYAGVMGLDVQPASFVDGRMKFDLNIASVNTTLFTNATQFNTSGMPGWWYKSFAKDTAWISPDSTFVDRHFSDVFKSGSGKSWGVYSNLQVDILNFAFHVSPKISFGLGLKARMIANVGNGSIELFKLYQNDFDLPNLFGKLLDNQGIDANALAWKEYKLNYGQVLLDRNQHFLKMGVNLKAIQGVASGFFNGKNIELGLDSKDTSYVFIGDFKYGYSSNFDNLTASDFITKSATPLSFGFDLGFVYEYRPKYQEYRYSMDGKENLWRRDKNKYLARVGVSLLDVGRMKFTKGDESRDFRVDMNVPFNIQTIHDINSFEDLNHKVDSLIQASVYWNDVENNKTTYYQYLPMALSIQADVKIWKDFYVGMTGMLNLNSRKNQYRSAVANQISITPSYDFAWASIHLPISYNEYSGFKAGVATRLGPITVGVTDFRALFAVGKVRGAGIYAGLRLPILYGEPKDKDNDGVSDKLDECPTIPGLWAFRGCPDTDNDGIPDDKDECPLEAGIAAFNGCPDSDGDGVADKDDACPTEKGLVEFKGCPDSDGDGIPDKDDVCPEVAGLLELNGCPDTDGDGIADKDDLCPDRVGTREDFGCPDTDQDGLLDHVDNCPDIAGPVENGGCPWPDTDGDGILDKDDKCPTIAGPASNNGCPENDADGDGVPDKEDDCPNTFGPKENKGCPEVEEEVKVILKTAFDNLEFETGKDVILPTSFNALDELANVLIAKGEWKLQIEGHTDNVGKAAANLTLSKKRAEAVKNYLVAKGVKENQIKVLYFGQTKPVASNSTAEGRQKNRRVEMKVIFD